MVVEPRFDDAACFVEGLALVSVDGERGYIDKNFNVVYTMAAQGSDCERTADHVLKLMNQDMQRMFEGRSKEQVAWAKVDLEKELDRARLVTECEKKKFTRGELDCFMAAVRSQSLPCAAIV